MKTPSNTVEKNGRRKTPADHIDLIYKIEGERSEVDVLELSRVLDSIDTIAKESYRVAHPDEGELKLAIKPFKEGSFIMDIALQLQQNPAVLFVLSHPEVRDNLKSTLEAIGFIKKVNETGASLLELIKKLKDGKPEKVEKKGEKNYEYHAGDNSVIPVNSTVHNLYNNPVIQNMTINVYSAAEKEGVDGILTYLKGSPAQTSVKVNRGDLKAIRAYSEPKLETPKKEVLEDTTTKFLSPKSGSYGQTTGTWSFTISGTKRVIKAQITDQNFLKRYSAGTIRFYQGDRLKAKLKEKQIVEGDTSRMEYEITEVVEYIPAKPSLRDFK